MEKVVLEMSGIKKQLLLLMAVAVFASCDRVKNAELTKPCALKDIHITNTNSDINTRKVLVQDYTGHTCGNCPRAAEDLENIVKVYPETVIAMAVHAGTQFSPPKLPDFPEDFRSAIGTAWDDKMGYSAAGLPRGTVNWAQTPYPQARNKWASLVATQLAMPQKAKIEMTSRLDTNAMSVAVETKVTLLVSTNFHLKIALVILEDSIIARQKDYNPPVGAIVENTDERPDYVFMHMLRGGLTGVAGDVLKRGPVADKFEITKTYCGNITPWVVDGNPKKNLKNVSVVAIVYTEDYNGAAKEVLQVEKLHVK
jgi:hypothetical protein